jgi:hypothetical protein
MPRLSLWQDGRHSNDYKFIDRRVSEMFTIGGTGILVNKYLGVNTQGVNKTTSTAQITVGNILEFSNTTGVNVNDFVFASGVPAGTKVVSKTSTTVVMSAPTTAVLPSNTAIGFGPDATRPSYANQSELNIQDLLWLENRDRKYETNVYKMRGIYQRADQDFDLSQFGLFLQTGTLFMVFHLRDMVDTLGRKLLAGDVLELQHLKDYDALGDLPAALKRYYVVADASFAAEGFSPTWWPHLWRVKLNPLVDSQEYKDILDNLKIDTDGDGVEETPVGQIISTYDKFLDINEQILVQAEIDVPKSGYDTSTIYTLATNQDRNQPIGNPVTADNASISADNVGVTADTGASSPLKKVQGYLTGDGQAPNGLTTGAGVAFPPNPSQGDFFLRLDYLPNRLFRYTGSIWSRVEDAVRTNLTPGTDNKTQRMSYVNNTNTYTDAAGETRNQRVPLSRVFTPKADN